MRTVSVAAECESCAGSGIYSGFHEAEGTAVVCVTCDGTGCMNIDYKPFEKRRRKRGIKTVGLSRWRLSGGGSKSFPDYRTISYADFCKGKLPGDENE